MRRQPMQSPTPENLRRFLAELGRRCNYPASIYIFGGSAPRRPAIPYPSVGHRRRG